MTPARRRVLFGAFLIFLSAALARVAWSQWPGLPDLSFRLGSETRPALDPGGGTVPPLRPAGEWTVVPGMEALPLPVDSIADAISIYRRLLPFARLGGDAAHARGLAFLAGLEGAIRRVDESERHYTEARALLVRHSPRGRDLAWLLNQQGNSRLGRGAYAAAVESFQASLATFPESAAELARERIQVQQNLATAHFALGDLEAADATYLEALRALEATPDARARAFLLQNLAGLHTTMGDFPKAVAEFEEALAVAPKGERFLRAVALNGLGDALRGLEHHDEAEARFLEANEELQDWMDFSRVVVLNRMGNAWDAGRPEPLEAVLAEARTLSDGKSEVPVVYRANLAAFAGRLAAARGEWESAEGQLAEAVALLRERAPGERRFLAELVEEQALVADRRGRRGEALERGRRAFGLELERLDQILDFGSERDRLAYQRQARPYDHLAMLGDTEALAEAVFQAKGAVLDSQLVERRVARRVGDGPARRRLDQIRELRLAVLDATARGSTVDGLAAELKSAETALAAEVGQAVKAERSRVTARAVQTALGADEVLLELVEFETNLVAERPERRLGALVVPPRGTPRWLPLGTVRDVEEALGRFLGNAENTSRGAARPPSREAHAPRGALEALSAQLWRPLAAVLPPGTKKLVIAPDGVLHFVPWAALLDLGEHFVAERFDVSTVASGRDLLRPAERPAERSILVLGDGRSDLPFARKEAEEIERLAAANGWSSTLLLGEGASEPALRQWPNPTILHLATHGSQLADHERDAVASRLSRQPMYRGHLMLGGTNATLRAWREGRVVPVERDGILTADEVAGLDLGRTWLAVLSACDTGLGESRSGEGVLGLRRGFALAGARQFVFSLWPVDDRATAEFMTDFYTALFAGREPGAAFAATQRKLLVAKRAQGGEVAAAWQVGAFLFGR